jgi:hypothetical protein
LSEKTQKNISDDMASWSANLKANKDYFKTYSYANGNYAIDLSLTKETLLGLMSAATSAASSEAGGMTSAISSIERMISKFVTINACQEVFVFNDKGPVSSALNVDIAVNTTLGEIYSEATSGVSSAESIPDGYSSAKEAVSFKFAYNMDFLSGDNVAVSEVFRSIGNDFHIYMEEFLNVLSLISQGANKKQCLLSKTCRKPTRRQTRLRSR